MEIHKPKPFHGWREFGKEVGVIVVGILIAIGLEQTVESLHHRHQRAELEERMREAMEANTRYIAFDLQRLAGLRSYLVELQQAVASRLRGDRGAASPAESDPRNETLLRVPNLGAFEAAKADGSVALLRNDRVVIYGRVAYLTGLMQAEFAHWRDALSALRAFRQRFDASQALTGRGMPITPADLAGLSTAQLLEYQALIGDALEASDRMAVRLRRLDAQNRAVLQGAHDESELMDGIAGAPGGDGARPPP